MAKDRKAKAKKARQKEQRAAELRKAHEKLELDYYRNLFALLDKLGVKEHLRLFDRIDMFCSFRARTSGLLFEQVGPQKPLIEVEQFAKRLIKAYLSRKTYTYTNGAVITGHEVLFNLESFRFLIGFKVRSQMSHYEEIEKNLWGVKEFLDACLMDLQEGVKDWLRVLCCVVAVPYKENVLFRVEHEIASDKAMDSLDQSYTCKLKIFYEVAPVEQKMVVVDGISRPCYRFQIGDVGSKACSLTIQREHFGFKGTPVDVYLQSHAIERLAERLDSLLVGVAFGLCIKSISANPKVHDVGGGRYLLEVTLLEGKIGYFAAYLVDGILLVKTFLFVTNSSTPEGARLDKISGLSKVDKEYLKIDKLSTFLTINAADAPKLKGFLDSAGLGYLLKLQGSSLAFWAAMTPNKSPAGSASVISSYLKDWDLDMRCEMGDLRFDSTQRHRDTEGTGI